MAESTLARTVAGLLPVSRGEVLFGAEAVTALPPAARCPPPRLRAAGAGTVPGLVGAGQPAHRPRIGPRPRAAAGRSAALVPVLGRRLPQVAGTPSGGEQKVPLLARALLTRPRLVVLDEISEGLQPSVVDGIAAALLDRLRDGRTSPVLPAWC